jgi:hypothetical protein
VLSTNVDRLSPCISGPPCGRGAARRAGPEELGECCDRLCPDNDVLFQSCSARLAVFCFICFCSLLLAFVCFCEPFLVFNCFCLFLFACACFCLILLPLLDSPCFMFLLTSVRSYALLRTPTSFCLHFLDSLASVLVVVLLLAFPCVVLCSLSFGFVCFCEHLLACAWFCLPFFAFACFRCFCYFACSCVILLDVLRFYLLLFASACFSLLALAFHCFCLLEIFVHVFV